MCTHLHVDSRLEHADRERAPGADLPESPIRSSPRRNTSYWAGEHEKTPVPPFGDSVLPIVEAKRAELVRDDHQLGDHVRLMPTPGHTPGHVAIGFGRGGETLSMPGDLMHSPLQARYPELSPRFEPSMAQAVEDAALSSSSAIATRRRSAAPPISPRPRSAGSSAGTAASAASQWRGEDCAPRWAHFPEPGNVSIASSAAAISRHKMSNDYRASP